MAYQLWKSPKIFGSKTIQGKAFVGPKNRKRFKKSILWEENPKEKLKVRVPLARCPFVLQTKKSSPPFARDSQVEGNTGRLLKLKICKEENECVMTKQKVNRTKIIMVRLTTDEYEQILKKYKSTICRKLSDYLRNVLLNRKVTVLTRNQSLDDFMAEMIALRKELNRIGNNFNQAVHKLHLLDRIPEFRTWIIQSEQEKKVLLKKIEEIKYRVNQFAEKW